VTCTNAATNGAGAPSSSSVFTTTDGSENFRMPFRTSQVVTGINSSRTWRRWQNLKQSPLEIIFYVVTAKNFEFLFFDYFQIFGVVLLFFWYFLLRELNVSSNNNSTRRHHGRGQQKQQLLFDTFSRIALIVFTFIWLVLVGDVLCGLVLDLYDLVSYRRRQEVMVADPISGQQQQEQAPSELSEDRSTHTEENISNSVNLSSTTIDDESTLRQRQPHE
jgi:hypothetical protein